MVKRLLVIFFSSWILSGCVAGQHINLDHTTVEPQKKISGISVVVKVEDTRSFVVDKKKDASYIGHYRAGFGNPFDVTTKDKIPLQAQIQSDLVDELTNLGYTVKKPGNTLLVSIQKWNFDALYSGKFWYQLKIEVLNSKGKSIISNSLSDEIIFKSGGMAGAKYVFEKELPGHYDAIIDKIVRKNNEILSALSKK